MLPPDHQARAKPRVVIAGAGVAGVEGLLALRALAGEGPRIELVAPHPSLIYRPLRVREPFDAGEVRRFSIEAIAAQHGATFRAGGLTSVDPVSHQARLRDGTTLQYDFLLIATGARTHGVLPGTIGFSGPAGTSDMAAALEQVRTGAVRSLAFAVPQGASWPLPLYELALLTAWKLEQESLDGVALTLVTTERAPLELFGEGASRQLRATLQERGIDVLTSSFPQRAEGGRLRLADGSSVAADRTFTVPALRGPGILGLPCDDEGFLPIDEHSRVREVEDVFAAGDGADHPIKQGGLATQQADAAAETIASRLGAMGPPQPFAPVLRAILLTGGAPLYLRASTSGTEPPELSSQALWWPPGKIAGRYLSPYLAQLERPAPEPPTFQDRDPSTDGHALGSAPDHEQAVQLALAMADDGGREGDHSRALEWLGVAERLDGLLPSEYVAKQRRWRLPAR